MATDIVGGLFGMTPEMYQRDQNQQALAQAAQLGQMDPFASARTSLIYGGRQLGGAIAGALGAEDPQLRIISARNAVLREINPNDPESIMAGAQKLAQVDPQGANALANQAREAQVKLAQIVRYTREGRAASVGQDVLKAETEAGYLAAIRQLQGMEQTPENVAALQVYKDKLAALTRTKPEKDPRFGIDREALSEEKFGMSFASLTQEQKATVNKLIEDQRGTIADKGAVKVYPPGAPVAQKDWMDFRKFVDSNPTMKKTSALISEAPSAFDTINRITSNDIASKALPATLARLTGETGPLSKADIQRFARTGGLDDRLAQSATEFFSGRGTTQQKEQAQKYVSAIYRGALIEQKNFVINEAKQLGYTKSPNYESFIQSIDEQLGKFKEFTPPAKTGVENPPANVEKPSGQTGFSARRIN
jgi:hypothetical protein